MSRIAKRFLSATARRNASAADACAEIFERFGNKPIPVRKQLFDANQVQLLSITLNRPNLHQNISILDSAPKDGTPIPPGYHLVYFTPSILEQDLGLDGTDRTVNPLNPYTRRMWAGGELHWSQDPSNFLRVGQTVQETTKILSAEPKKLRSGGEMCVVGVEKTFENDKGVALVDKRSWVFQKEITDARAPPPKPEEKPLPNGNGQHVKDFQQTDVTLFRFSALTFNGHKIHYSKPWCQEVEGHRDCVVHGPLNLINMLDFWRDTARDAEEDAVPKSIAYRAMSPLYVGEPYRLLLGKEAGREESGAGWKAEFWDSYGKVSMKGTIVQ
ncbi:hypothetical protein BDV96DRAFT_613466 [Lophiotrema nucula]|uniref:N-terminal of MaoC-like dehydratase domain-containing protein n=1 Tax=Lophiotrema nucula TaxID=690887 RepID=A0A6A5Z583_9PLEO|nr:hypothetical protein BDV96DRAFT_613466 [Lophiotrema nucula]